MIQLYIFFQNHCCCGKRRKNKSTGITTTYHNKSPSEWISLGIRQIRIPLLNHFTCNQPKLHVKNRKN